jgi:hypothetical protein
MAKRAVVDFKYDRASIGKGDAAPLALNGKPFCGSVASAKPCSMGSLSRS